VIHGQQLSSVKVDNRFSEVSGNLRG